MLEPAEEAIAERALAGRYGLGRELFERAMDVLRVDMCFLELTPGAWGRSEAAETASGRRGALAETAARRERVSARGPSATNAGGAIARYWSNTKPLSRRFSKQRMTAVSERLGVIRPTACWARSSQLNFLACAAEKAP